VYRGRSYLLGRKVHPLIPIARLCGTVVLKDNGTGPAGVWDHRDKERVLGICFFCLFGGFLKNKITVFEAQETRELTSVGRYRNNKFPLFFPPSDILEIFSL